MKKFNAHLLSVFALFSFLVFASQAQAVETPAAKPSPELMAKGRALFNSKEGLKIKFACILCHKQDKAVKLSKIEKLGDKFPTVINKYIVGKSKGKALAADSEEMKALMAYIQFEHAK